MGKTAMSKKRAMLDSAAETAQYFSSGDGELINWDLTASLQDPGRGGDTGDVPIGGNTVAYANVSTGVAFAGKSEPATGIIADTTNLQTAARDLIEPMRVAQDAVALSSAASP